jgi:hypothetical protein
VRVRTTQLLSEWAEVVSSLNAEMGMVWRPRQDKAGPGGSKGPAICIPSLQFDLLSKTAIKHLVSTACDGVQRANLLKVCPLTS